MAVLSKEEALQDLAAHFTSPPHPVAYAGIKAIAKHYRGSVSEKDIADFLNQYDTHTLHRQVKKPRQYSPIYVRATREIIFGDLATFHEMGKHNRGFNFIMVLVDGFSRRLFCLPLVSKSAEDVKNGLKRLVETQIGKFDKLVTDAGKEWFNDTVKEYLTSIGSRLIYPRTSGKSLPAERCIYTLKVKIAKYCTFHDTKSFVDALPLLVGSYNHAIHRGIMDRPMRVDTLEEAQRKLRLKLEEKYASLRKTLPKYAVHDLVRISRLSRNKFTRGFEPKFSREIYQVFLVHQHLPQPLYTLKDLWDTEYIKGRFLEQELRPIKLSLTHHINRVLQREGRFVTVNFLSLPPTARATIHDKNIVD